MSFDAMIVAAGRGTRAGDGLPKQYRPLGGVPVLTHAAQHLLAHPGLNRLVIVIHAEDQARFDALGLRDPRLAPPVIGGASRSASVRAGLAALSGDQPILVHDAARPFLPPEVIDRLLIALDNAEAAIPVLPVVDALWRGGKIAERPEPRDALWRAQTPQAFHAKTLRQAHEKAGEAADDAALVHQMGGKIALVTGDERLYKLTYPADFARAEKEL
ncbi:2-C-methyl-D-erythritol 4-phosphate cytidylyltransferase [Paracoccaceae bacterium GXU_MW_L88]